MIDRIPLSLISLASVVFSVQYDSLLNAILGGIGVGVVMSGWAWDISPETASYRWRRLHKKDPRPGPSAKLAGVQG